MPAPTKARSIVPCSTSPEVGKTVSPKEYFPTFPTFRLSDFLCAGLFSWDNSPHWSQRAVQRSLIYRVMHSFSSLLWSWHNIRKISGEEKEKCGSLIYKFFIMLYL